MSRFPHVSETFIVRELDAVDERGGIDLELLSLFPPVNPTVHPAARRWMERLRRVRPVEALRATAWWLLRRPGRLIGSTARAVWSARSHPAVLVRTLATVPLAAAHARTVQRLAVDHVHAHWATYPAFAAWLCERLTGVTYSFTAHAHDLYVHQAFLAEKARAAHFVVTISDYNRRFLEPYGGGRETPVEVVHCGIDPAAYEFRPRLPASAGPVRALCVASLQEYKGHAVLLEALTHPEPALERIELDLVGGGPLRGPLEALATRLGLLDRVHFRGSLPEPEVRALLDRADIFVLPSIVARDGQMEGLPVALMEALAAGVPVVTTRLSGIPELVRDGETGLLAEPGDPSSLANALVQALSEPARAARRAEAGRRLVEAEFDVRAAGERLAELFEGAARPPTAASA
ncbi:MAG: glycosyltransferase [Thermoleophilaceae bacterium]